MKHELLPLEWETLPFLYAPYKGTTLSRSYERTQKKCLVLVMMSPQDKHCKHYTDGYGDLGL